ncbi:hypothetical protein [Streptococcus danieliae]|uniref:hypothetical protein n=1 Tax=Streptococcus danieliae TaxID=747656 RepID=UPI0021C6E95B|nr:hypothetical protein [Streptococcus danieliae]MCU0081961.1 hypothetical protein [Streptococcus danieliae]
MNTIPLTEAAEIQGGSQIWCPGKVLVPGFPYPYPSGPLGPVPTCPESELIDVADLQMITGGAGYVSEAGSAIGKTWAMIYKTGRDFGRSLVNALIP